MIQKEADTKSSLLFQSLMVQPKLALLYYKHGASTAIRSKEGYTPLMQMILKIDRNYYIENITELAQYLVALGVPVNKKSIINILLEHSKLLSDDKEKLIKAIDQALKNNKQITTQRTLNLPKILSTYCIKELIKIILSYDDSTEHIIPYDISNKIEEVDVEADLALVQLTAKVEKESKESSCIIL